MKPVNEVWFKMVLIFVFIGFIIGSFNKFLGSFFMFGGGLMSFLYEWFGMIRDTPKKKKKKLLWRKTIIPWTKKQF